MTIAKGRGPNAMINVYWVLEGMRWKLTDQPTDFLFGQFSSVEAAAMVA